MQQYGQLIVNDDAAPITGANGRVELPRGEIITINRTSADVYGMMTAKAVGRSNTGSPTASPTTSPTTA